MKKRYFKWYDGEEDRYEELTGKCQNYIGNNIYAYPKIWGIYNELLKGRAFASVVECDNITKEEIALSKFFITDSSLGNCNPPSADYEIISLNYNTYQFLYNQKHEEWLGEAKSKNNKFEDFKR